MGATRAGYALALSAAQMRLVVAVTAAAALVQTLGASFNYVLIDMLRDLGPQLLTPTSYDRCRPSVRFW